MAPRRRLAVSLLAAAVPDPLENEWKAGEALANHHDPTFFPAEYVDERARSPDRLPTWWRWVKGGRVAQ